MPPDWIKTKKRFRLFTPVDPQAIPLTDRLVYSYLAFRARKGLGASARGIAENTGLDRKDGVGAALDRLQGRGLVRGEGGDWVAVEPTDDANPFFALKEGAHWSQRIGYVWYSPPASTLSTTQAYLLWTAVAHPERTYNVTGLSNLLGLTRKTVSAALDALDGLGILSRVPAGGYRFRLEIRDLPADLFRDNKPAASKDPVWAQYENYLVLDEVPKSMHAGILRQLVARPDRGTVMQQALLRHQEWLKTHPDGPRHCGFRLQIELQKSRGIA